MELFSEKLSHVSSKQVGETLKLKASDGPVPEFHLGHGGTRESEMAGNFLLRHLARFPCGPKPSSKLLLADRHTFFSSDHGHATPPLQRLERET
jgi:hypothetical protein